jgi:hypothetical protein
MIGSLASIKAFANSTVILCAMHDTRFHTRPETDLPALLLGLECQLMDPSFRKDREKVSTLLAEEFREFGSSGRVWSRETILDLLATEAQYTAPQVEDFAVQCIAPETALVTYRTVRISSISDAPPQVTLRSSIWVLRKGFWRVLFHQGTKIPNV